MKNSSYAVFGLGNKTYPHYNVQGKQFDKRLEELGGHRFFELGLGDDDANLEDDFAMWKKRMWPVLCAKYGLSANVQVDVFEPRFTLQQLNPDQLKQKSMLAQAKKKQNEFDLKNPFDAVVVENRELHSNQSDRSCRHVSIEIGRALHYEAGDHLGVYAQNDLTLVHKLAKRLNVENLDQGIVLVDKNGQFQIGPCSVKEALLSWVDITAPLRKHALRALSQYTNDEKEKQRLKELGDDENPEPYTSYVKEAWRSPIEILKEFKNVKVPLGVMMEILPRLVPRYYSISSSPKHTAGVVTITVVHTEFKTGTGRVHKGVASTWLRDIKPGDAIPVFVRKSQFKMPADAAAPMIMIGPGTGLAPFRGFLQELALRGDASSKHWLFFGCRNRSIDYIYQEELTRYQEQGLIKLLVAFSREQDHKIYVQDLVRQHQETLCDLVMRHNAHLYICGDAKAMEPAVEQVLHAMLAAHTDAAVYIAKMKETNRYLTDTWY